MVIAVDFDGTCVTHEYPRVGQEIGAADVLRELVKKGHQLILYTMRHGQHLDDAIKWFVKHNIALYGCQVNPTQHEWTGSSKCYAQLYIDDAALGCPLVFPEKEIVDTPRPYVDWVAVKKILTEKGIL